MRRVDYIGGASDFKTLVGEQFMQDAVYCFTPEDEGETLAETLTEERFGNAPVVDQHRRLVGIMGEFGLLHSYGKERKAARIHEG